MISLALNCVGVALYVVTFAMNQTGRIEYRSACATNVIAAALCFVADVMDHAVIGQAIQCVVGVLNAWLWWRNGGGGRFKRAARELGEKSKARVQALVEQMTPSPIPSPAGGGA